MSAALFLYTTTLKEVNYKDFLQKEKRLSKKRDASSLMVGYFALSNLPPTIGTKCAKLVPAVSATNTSRPSQWFRPNLL